MPTPSHRPPLAALLGKAHTRFVAEYEQGLAEAGYPDLSLAHTSNVLRHLQTGRAVPTAALVRLSGVTKQAISQQLGHLVDHGYIAVEPDPGDSRAKSVRLTSSGEAAQTASRRTFIALERNWRARYGVDRMQSLRETLETIIGVSAEG